MRPDIGPSYPHLLAKVKNADRQDWYIYPSYYILLHAVISINLSLHFVLLQNLQQNDSANLEMLKCLNKHGANFRYAKDQPLYLACCHFSEEIIKFMLELGCQPSDKFLHALCARNRFSGVVSHFLQHYPNLNVNSQDSTGRTPLLRAVGGGCDKTVWVLLSEFNADAHTTDAKGRSAIRYILSRVINTCGQKSNMLNIAAIFAYFNTKVSSEDIFYATQRMNCLDIAFLFLKYSAEFSYVQGLVNNSAEMRLHEMKVVKMVPEKTHPFLTFLKSKIGHVSSLKEFCRALLRKEIGVRIVKKVSELPLPKRMQEYVLIPELCKMVQRYKDDTCSENADQVLTETV